MHGSRASIQALLEALLQGMPRASAVATAVCVPLPYLAQVSERLRGGPIGWGAQNVSEHAEGAYTGETSAAMLAEFGCRYVLVGHSERRQLFAESDEALARKVPAALAAGLQPILCVGETLDEREGDETETVLRRQIETDLAGVADEELRKLVIAYEPVWAIGTGRNATPAQAAEAIAFIRSLVGGRDESAAAAVRILYGGSVKPENAAEVLAPDGIDGALVGGASLDPDDFAAVTEACR